MRKLGQELARHSTFIEDGRRLLETLAASPGVRKVRSGDMTGRRSSIRKIVIRDAVSSYEFALENTNGRQLFRVFTGGAAIDPIVFRLQEQFSEYQVIVRGRED